MEGKKYINITEKNLEDFQGMVESVHQTNPFKSTESLKYKIGSKVWVRRLGLTSEQVEIQKGEAGVYLVSLPNGQCIVCKEQDIQIMN